MAKLHYPTDPWYVEELAQHERRQTAVKKAFADAEKRTLPEADMPTIREQITEMVDQEARRMHRFGFGQSRPGYSVAKAKAELWESPEGRLLTQLLRSEVADMTVSEAKSAVRKSDDAAEFAKAFKVIEDGFPR